MSEVAGNDNLVVLPQTKVLLHLHSAMRSEHCNGEQFVYYAGRVNRLLLERAMEYAEYEECSVQTPVTTFDGIRRKGMVCGVSILRAGASMETALREVCPDAAIGKILIQRDETSAAKTATLLYSKLPDCITTSTVFLLDPMLATGGSASKAISCLLEKGVSESSIVFVNLVSCPQGLSYLQKQHPAVRIITSMVDPVLTVDKYISPGLGDFGDRFYGGVSK